MTTKLVFTFSLICCISCDVINEKKSEFEKRFDPRFIDHMINRDLTFFDNVVMYPNYEHTPTSLHHLGVWAIHTYKVTASDIESIKKEFDLNQMEFTTHSNSNCINCKSNFDCSKGELATPSFYFLRNKLEINSDLLPSEFRIYHIESKQGEFIPKTSLITNLCDSEWAHGYTKGIMINESMGLASFWVTVW